MNESYSADAIILKNVIQKMKNGRAERSCGVPFIQSIEFIKELFDLIIFQYEKKEIMMKE